MMAVLIYTLILFMYKARSQQIYLLTKNVTKCNVDTNGSSELVNWMTGT